MERHLEIFSRPQLTENSRQHLPLRTDILQKTVRRWVPPTKFRTGGRWKSDRPWTPALDPSLGPQPCGLSYLSAHLN